MVCFVLAALLLVSPPVAHDGVTASAGAAARQDTLAAARDLYTTAAYEDALAMLDRLRAAEPQSPDLLAIDQYRAFSLIALGRTADADRVIEAMTAFDPTWQLPSEEAPPRIAAIFATVRARVIPEVLRDRLAAARAHYTDKAYADAIEDFNDLLELLKAPSIIAAAGSDVTSLETIATGFRDLAVAADGQAKAAELAKAAEAKAAEAQRASADPAPDLAARAAAGTGTEPAANGAPAPSPAQSTAPVTPPGILSQAIPRPTDITLPIGAPATIVLDVLIDELGRVERVSVRQSVNRVYEAQLLNAARLWRYTPALRAGQPVKYLKTLEITLNPR